jgi:hypothetical protein
MAKVATILEDFIHSFKEEILAFYNRCYTYIKEILNDKNINLRRKTAQDDDKARVKTIETMLTAIRLAFMTVGISKARLTKDFNQLSKLKEKKGAKYQEYLSYFELDLKYYIDQVLLDILIEYLIDVDTIKMGNLDLFDLLPRNFINRLKEFKQQRITSTQIKNEIKKQMLDVKNDFIPADFEVEEVVEKPKDVPLEIPKPKPKEGMVVTAATPEVMKKFAEEKAEKKKIEANEVPTPATTKTAKKPLSPAAEAIIKELIPARLKFKLPKKPKSFLNYIGNFIPIDYDIIDRFDIDIVNLIDTKDNVSKFFNLEIMFYYITILRMINVNIPLTTKEITDILKKYTNGKVFSASKEAKPDPLNIFYGLAILSEIDLLYDKNIEFIDPMDIEMFLESELKDFMPEKLHLNFFTILCLKILEKSGGIAAAKTHMINPILSLDVLSSFHNNKENNPILDIFEHLSSIKMLDIKADLSHFKSLYTKEIKKLITEKGYVNDTITDSARALLIIDLLGLKKVEFNTCQHILNYLISGTRYFSSEHLDKRFNWRQDRIAFLIELRMLFWSLLACSQYKLVSVEN